ncbi:MAG: Hsp33 family molecular chaperone HslO [Deinococcales bacterium]
MAFLLRGLAANGSIRIVAADTSDLSREISERHEASELASSALGRSLSAALLLCHVLLKNPQDRLTLRIFGNGPLGGVIADAGLDGSVRAYVQHPWLEPQNISLRQALGKGDIEIIRSHAPYGDSYSSSIPLISGEIAEDVAAYLAQSEQILSAVLLGTFIEHGKVQRAGGIIFQALPNAEEAALRLLEANIKAFSSLSQAMGSMSLLEILHELCWGLELEILTENSLPLRFECRCSRQKALDALAYFSLEERQQMVVQEGGAEVICHWCNERRWFDADSL